jgi:voltage-gated sodium channel
MWWRGSAGSAAGVGDEHRDHARPQAHDQRDSHNERTQSSASIPRIEPLARLVDSERFQIFIGSVIVANAIVLGMETYPGLMQDYGSTLTTLNTVCYLVFLAELITRIASYGLRPWNFFRDGWNIFDFIVIGGALIPAVREQATVLRLLRLARIARLMRFLPDARVLLSTVTKATPAVLSMAVLTVLLLFIYGIVGWTMFGEALPEYWGTLGTAMLTLFVLLTLENFPVYLAEAKAVNSFATIYFLSYVLIAAFIIVNLLIGVVISSMERAREEEAATARKQGQDRKAAMLDHIAEMREALNELEGEVDGMPDRQNRT